MWWTILPKSSLAKAFCPGTKSAVTNSANANLNILLLLIMAALLLLFRLVRMFFSRSKMALQSCHFVHGDLAHQIDDRKFPGFCHQNHNAANLVTILKHVDLIVFVVALLHALDDLAPAR